MKKPYNRLTYLRKSKVLTQRDIAEQLGISHQYYGKLEKNPETINLGMALKLKDILKVTCVDELITEAS